MWRWEEFLWNDKNRFVVQLRDGKIIWIGGGNLGSILTFTFFMYSRDHFMTFHFVVLIFENSVYLDHFIIQGQKELKVFGLSSWVLDVFGDRNNLLLDLITWKVRRSENIIIWSSTPAWFFNIIFLHHLFFYSSKSILLMMTENFILHQSINLFLIFDRWFLYFLFNYCKFLPLFLWIMWYTWL